MHRPDTVSNQPNVDILVNPRTESVSHVQDISTPFAVHAGRGCAARLGRRSRHQLRYRRFFSRYLICLTWAESNPRAVPTSRLDRPATSISRAASVLVLV